MIDIIIVVLLFALICIIAWWINEHANKEIALDLVANDETRVLSKKPVKIPVRY